MPIAEVNASLNSSQLSPSNSGSDSLMLLDTEGLLDASAPDPPDPEDMLGIGVGHEVADLGGDAGAQ